MKVAIVHDDLTQRGGAERVVLAMQRLFPDADIYTSVYDPEGTFPEFRDFVVRTGFLQRLPHRRNWVRAWLPLYPLTFEAMRLTGYDLVISSSSRWAHGIHTDGALHICYCYSPARFLYQPQNYFGSGGWLPTWSRIALAPVLGALRVWDRKAARRPDMYVAISRAIAERIRATYERDSVVIHPPVDTKWITESQGVPPIADDPYYLVVSRLLSYKRIDLSVKVLSERGDRLVVIGDGPARSRLESLAGPTVTFLGHVEDATLVGALRGCRALIDACAEDFGLTVLEANAAGRPVMAFGSGGSLETVIDGETGILFHAQTAESLLQALDRLESTEWDSAALQSHAESFGEERFHQQLAALVETAVGNGFHSTRKREIA